MSDQVIVKHKHLLKVINRAFKFVTIDQFVFQDADYCEVVTKECEEIGHILNTYEIKIARLQNVYLAPERLTKAQESI